MAPSCRAKGPVAVLCQMSDTEGTSFTSASELEVRLFSQKRNLRRGDESQASSVFLSILRDLGGIEPGKIRPYCHEIAQWYMTLQKLQKEHPNHQPTSTATSSSSPPHTPNTHFVREKQLCLACRLAFVKDGKLYRPSNGFAWTNDSEQFPLFPRCLRTQHNSSFQVSLE